MGHFVCLPPNMPNFKGYLGWLCYLQSIVHIDSNNILLGEKCLQFQAHHPKKNRLETYILQKTVAFQLVTASASVGSVIKGTVVHIEGKTKLSASRIITPTPIFLFWSPMAVSQLTLSTPWGGFFHFCHSGSLGFRSRHSETIDRSMIESLHRFKCQAVQSLGWHEVPTIHHTIASKPYSPSQSDCHFQIGLIL